MRRHPRPPIGPPGLGPPGALRGIRGPPPPPHHIGPGPRGIPPLSSLGPPHGPLPGAISSCTNSTDPASMDSRLFVGNLNTIAMNKDDVEAIFGQYGTVLGISLHKGFAFVQFRHPDDARFAGASEDGKVYAGQAIDINIVSQPKNRSALKRSNSGKGNNDSPTKKTRQEGAGSASNQSLQRTLVTLSSVNSDNSNNARNKNKSKQATSKFAPINSSNSCSSSIKSSDILICGVCKLQFTNLNSLAQHKQNPCRLRFTCECNSSGDASEEPAMLLQCARCDSEFVSAWDLCQHCTEEHQMSIYKTEAKKENQLSNKEEAY